ncbi:hypothetical protein [Thiocystis violascens]|uniref:Putative low-complexity protein n=1 Tax=Thiocystis violascens (strain ATCC 17096 / DSM 198 / 6111) TaxID=765911 RepID=I3YH23_THIV6|nr:hypothetical protein [Thiocystis violascens]AFL76291.1 putative low-complexity protein [Thiocystis violascens DSM 198]
MSNKTLIYTTLAGAALVGSLATFGLAQAADNPFAVQALDRGYVQLAESDAEGKCGEGKDAEGKCGEGKSAEGKCGEGEGEGEGDKAAEGKCGEGKCGGKK